MEEQKKEIAEKVQNEIFIGDDKLFDTAKKVVNMVLDIVDLLHDKYPTTTPEEVAVIGMQLFWDSCSYGKLEKKAIISLANRILKEM